jgi:peptidoglycan-N-acetylglucosamine deacetylase
MKNIIKHRFLSNQYLVITTEVILVFILGCTILIALPNSFSDNLSVNNKKTIIKQPTSDIKPETKPVTKPVPVVKPQPVQPKFVADYSIPPVTNGLAPVVYTLPTNQNVIFLGIDDGAFKDQSVIDIMKKNNIKASLFLSKAFISSDPQFFKQLVDIGSAIEDHTLSHDTDMIKNQGYDQMVSEICGMSDYEYEQYGTRPTLFRPPGGAYNDTMLKAAADCGMKAVVTWIAKANGGSMQYQIGDKLRPGDVVLMHFRPEFAADMQAFVDAINAAGLHTELLENAI